MPINSIPNSKENTLYYLICYDEYGNERNDDPDIEGSVLSTEVINQAQSDNYTDVFFMCHGWKGDIPAAVDQFNHWTSSMVACEKDIARLQARPQGFKPLVIGLHWPSLIFGVENHASSEENDNKNDHDDNHHIFDFAVEGNTDSDRSKFIENAIADTDEGRKAVRILFDAMINGLSPDRLDTDIKPAINFLLEHEIFNQPDDFMATEMEPKVDAESLYQAFLPDDALVSFGGSVDNPITGIMTQLSAWKMKSRARVFGENGGAKLLRNILTVASSDVQVHLMGHSFGAIVVSSSIVGKRGNEPLPRPINTIYLVQGAVSLWSYCQNIPVQSGTSGYYHALSKTDYLSGPILVTHTRKDTALKKIYPWMERLVFFGESISFEAQFPKYGALGVFGGQGEGININPIKMLPLNGHYHFTPQTFFNLNADDYIKENESTFSGAHNDIAHPEVAHVLWSAIK